MNRHHWFEGLLLLLLPLMVACQSWGGADKDVAEDYTLSLTLDKSVYRPGEAVIATLRLVNNTTKPVQMRKPNPASVSFFFGRLGDPERMKRMAVASNQEAIEDVIDLPPGKDFKRQFLITRFTQYEGPMVCQAHYEPNPGTAIGTFSKLYSNNQNFQVTGQRLFERDPAGLITKQEAIRVAQTQAQGDVLGAEAILVEDETGMYLWQVNVQTSNSGLKSWVVNPYTGRVKGEAHPFDPDLAKDPRIQTPPDAKRRARGAEDAAVPPVGAVAPQPAAPPAATPPVAVPAPPAVAPAAPAPAAPLAIEPPRAPAVPKAVAPSAPAVVKPQPAAKKTPVPNPAPVKTPAPAPAH